MLVDTDELSAPMIRALLPARKEGMVTLCIQMLAGMRRTALAIGSLANSLNIITSQGLCMFIIAQTLTKRSLPDRSMRSARGSDKDRLNNKVVIILDSLTTCPFHDT